MMRVHLACLFVAALSMSTIATAQAPTPMPDLYTQGVVAADHELASQAGLEMLQQGGSAVDAAVAASFCLSVVRPMSCGLGGGGFMVVHLKDNPNTPQRDTTSIALNYRERAPAAVEPDHFADLDDPQASRFTGHAVGVPGTVAGLLHALEKYGLLDRQTVLAPAIRAATEGFTVDASYMRSAREAIEWFQQDPRRKQTRSFLWGRLLRHGEVKEGDVIKLPEQAEALRLIAEHGRSAFYNGPIAKAVIQAVQNAGGVMNQDDLRDYKISEFQPLRGEFRDSTLLTMPPPSSGGVATIQILGALEQYERLHGKTLNSFDHNSAAYAHLLTEAFKHAFADRARWLGDAEMVDVPVERLTSPAYLRSLAERIDPAKTLESSAYGSRAAPPDDAGTSHLSVVDAEGNAVACTETINLTFGSRIAVAEFGFFLNNEMDDFTTALNQANAFGLRQSKNNRPAPGKRPLSSMSPTILLDRESDVLLVTGASGGPRIITAVVQTLLNATVFDMDARRAVAEPRFHHQWWPNVLALEPAWRAEPQPANGQIGLNELRELMSRVENVRRFRAELRRRGHQLGEVKTVGVVQLIRRAEGGYQAASDPRKGGEPAGR